jgi:hypothetical protein
MIPAWSARGQDLCPDETELWKPGPSAAGSPQIDFAGPEFEQDDAVV